MGYRVLGKRGEKWQSRERLKDPFFYPTAKYYTTINKQELFRIQVQTFMCWTKMLQNYNNNFPKFSLADLTQICTCRKIRFTS